MPVAALYDIHGNLAALESVLEEVDREQVDAIVVGGDVLYGPFQSECLAVLRERRSRFLAGNCEREVLDGVDETSVWCRDMLAPDELAFVATWPSTVELEISGLGRVHFCHATPRSDTENVTRLTPDRDVAVALEGVDAEVVVCGHTHVQHERRVANRPRLVNAGSVGLPYEGRPGAFWALLGAGVAFRRTSYDVEPAIESAIASGFPSASKIYGESLRGSVSAESATAYFESLRGA
jgi:predicted phosphodiesterase